MNSRVVTRGSRTLPKRGLEEQDKAESNNTIVDLDQLLKRLFIWKKLRAKGLVIYGARQQEFVQRERIEVTDARMKNLKPRMILQTISQTLISHKLNTEKKKKAVSMENSVHIRI